ncbi:MAG: TrpR family transcriptional regulator, trp operon repressor [Pseudomonadota bacterium]|nr:TrpR family transcriptional regulator, trp operon repressor [Pseudomonadota bacterium]
MQNPAWQAFVDKLLQLKTKEQLNEFLNVLLTLSEIDELSKRHAIICALLRNDKTQREIARDLKVSIANVSRGANELKTCSDQVKEMFL